MKLIRLQKDTLDRTPFGEAVFVMFAAPGAMGEAGVVYFVTRDKQMYGFSYVRGELTLDDVLPHFPMLAQCNFTVFGRGSEVPDGWHYLYGGTGHHMVIADEIFAQFQEYSRHYTYTNEICRDWRTLVQRALGPAVRFCSLREVPEYMHEAARWFSSKWSAPTEAYLECMDAYLCGDNELGWYLCLHNDRIVGGLGVVENDFHNRPDLTPNICAVYTEPEFRGNGIAGQLLNKAVEDLRENGISPVYLVTDHTGFYERYGWDFLCHVRSDGEDTLSRMYIHE